MRSLGRLTLFVGIVMGLLGAPPPSSASTLTFAGGCCNADGTFTGFPGGIPGIYGSRDVGQPGPNQYDLMGTGWTPHIVTAWSGLGGGENFGSLDTVAALYSTGVFGQMTLIPDPGFNVVFNSLDIAAFVVSATNQTTVRVLDASFSVLWSGTFTAPTVGALHLTPNISSSGAIYLQFGGATPWVGMSNVDFNEMVTPTHVPEPVPEPSTWLLLGTGFVALAARRRLAKRT